MRLSPPQPYNNDSYAELQIFDAFRSVEMSDAICFNSLHLVSHREKKMSEIDFVLVCHKGIFVFEVKGGRVFQKSGKWYSRSKQKSHSIENPFNQARSALFSLVDSLKLEKILSPRVPIGYGVLLPNTVSSGTSVEYDALMSGSKTALKGFSSWLENFIQFWVNKVKAPTTLSSEDITKIANYLRPNSLVSDKPLSSFEKLNGLQQQVITAFEYDKRVICDGAAGTGKTLLVEVIAKECISDDKKLLVLCESKWLKGRLKTRLHSTNIVVATIDSLQVDSRRAFISQYDVVIVDEAQDLYRLDKINLLDKYINGGLDKGKWIFFQDLANQSVFFSTPETEAIEKIKNASDVSLSLDTAYRYSRTTLNYISDLLGKDKLPTKKVNGPEVELFASDDEDSERKNIETIIYKVLSLGYRHSDITLLSDNLFIESVVSQLPKSLLTSVIQVDDFNVRTFPLGGISFSELEHFKGLENKVVILVDFSKKCLDNTPKAYVAMTRASERLFIAWTSDEQTTYINVTQPTEVSVLDETSETTLAPGWKEVLETTLLEEECETFIAKKLLPPICGYELIVDEMVVSDAELAWPKVHLCIFSDETEHKDIEKFKSEGWRCYQTPLTDDELDEVSKIISI
ncbi:nuclease-related domain-containing DEAD/DEAH box helicase [Vibrio ezurae]|uniref:DNA 3'-5' helicase II n=1 Tax=Vibrio ezurae NBRC 102218 TaxID=1219080 RepID=U3CNQ3_9VIBR|nr:NERD domain-containing protein [Vibrio ezurae]GAD79753.1 hypothetical protein VEZ01S_20_00250 [Vibrio ezurae NBRC 102218]